METITRILIHADRGEVPIKMDLWEESPNQEKCVAIEAHFDERIIFAESDVGFFDALCVIRKELERSELLLRCAGASEDVFPSAMSRGMGLGDHAYRIRMGITTKSSDLVWIFSDDVDIITSTLDQQQSFFQRWLESLNVQR